MSESTLPVLIFAGFFREAHIYARNRGLQRGEWRYVRDWVDLQGISQPPGSFNCPVLRYFWDRKDARELEAAAISRGIKLVPDA